MKVIFLGVGEACDEFVPNNSHLIVSKTILLLDCGYSVPPQLWKYNPDAGFLDAIYISHRHADHYFGIPALLVRMWEEKRTKPLTIICQRNLGETIQELIEYGYKTLANRFTFQLNFMEVEVGKTFIFNEFELDFAPTSHSVNNLAIRVSDQENSVCYSGDGMFTTDTEMLYRNSDLLIHETYLFHQQTPGHASVDSVVSMAQENNVKCLALTHMQRTLRKKLIDEVRSLSIPETLRVIVPEPFEEYSF
jgi:ribonuclease BN (tRNA processing enzyme)